MQTTIGDRLRMIVDEYSMTLTGFSSFVDIPYSTMQNYVRNEREPTATSLIKMHNLARINVNWLLTGDGMPFLADYLDKKIVDKVLFVFINEILDICLKEGRSELTLHERQILVSYLMHHSKLGVGEAITYLIEDGDIARFGDIRNLCEWKEYIKDMAKPPKRERSKRPKKA